MRDIRIELKAGGPLPAVVADARNAMEAVEIPRPGARREISIEVAREGTEWVWVQVADRGVGIAQAELERVFEAFYSTKPSGLGIGQAICRKLIEAHGGSLQAGHNPGGGAVFRFTLPAVELAL
jgi:two-component system sensor kinase FixL